MSTIDPGIGATVKEAAEDVEVGPSKHQEVMEEEDPMAPSRWWFASTACPLLAATFGPIANGFSVCALVYSWREYLPGDTLVSFTWQHFHKDFEYHDSEVESLHST